MLRRGFDFPVDPGCGAERRAESRYRLGLGRLGRDPGEGFGAGPDPSAVPEISVDGGRPAQRGHDVVALLRPAPPLAQSGTALQHGGLVTVESVAQG